MQSHRSNGETHEIWGNEPVLDKITWTNKLQPIRPPCWTIQSNACMYSNREGRKITKEFSHNVPTNQQHLHLVRIRTYQVEIGNKYHATNEDRCGVLAYWKLISSLFSNSSSANMPCAASSITLQEAYWQIIKMVFVLIEAQTRRC